METTKLEYGRFETIICFFFSSKQSSCATVDIYETNSNMVRFPHCTEEAREISIKWEASLNEIRCYINQALNELLFILSTLLTLAWDAFLES